MSKVKTVRFWVSKADALELIGSEWPEVSLYPSRPTDDGVEIIINVPLPEKKKEFTASDLSALYEVWICEYKSKVSFHEYVEKEVFND